MRLLVCGGRDYKDLYFIEKILYNYKNKCQDLVIIQGGSRGADSVAKNWAEKNSIDCEQYDANWNLYGKGAGPIRNRIMAEKNIDQCVAFPGGRGTKDMIGVCNEKQIPVVTYRKIS